MKLKYIWVTSESDLNKMSESDLNKMSESDLNKIWVRSRLNWDDEDWI